MTSDDDPKERKCMTTIPMHCVHSLFCSVCSVSTYLIYWLLAYCRPQRKKKKKKNLPKKQHWAISIRLLKCVTEKIKTRFLLYAESNAVFFRFLCMSSSLFPSLFCSFIIISDRSTLHKRWKENVRFTAWVNINVFIVSSQVQTLIFIKVPIFFLLVLLFFAGYPDSSRINSWCFDSTLID